MKFLITFFCICFGMISNPTLDAFGKGNVDEISKQFATEVLISIGENIDFYSPDKAKDVLKTFFAKNKPSKITHIFDSNKKMLTGDLTCSTGVFRLSVVLENDKIVEIQLMKN